MKTITYKCDKCGKKFEYVGLIAAQYTSNSPSAIDFDLCRDCYYELKDWLRQKIRR